MRLTIPTDFPNTAPKGEPPDASRTSPSLARASALAHARPACFPHALWPRRRAARAPPPSAHSGNFITKIFHPNIRHSSGEICVNTLKKDWQPTHGLRRPPRLLPADPTPGRLPKNEPQRRAAPIPPLPARSPDPAAHPAPLPRPGCPATQALAGQPSCASPATPDAAVRRCPPLSARHILMVVRCLLIEPFPESALNEEAAKMLLEVAPPRPSRRQRHPPHAVRCCGRVAAPGRGPR